VITRSGDKVEPLGLLSSGKRDARVGARHFLVYFEGRLARWGGSLAMTAEASRCFLRVSA
jgi:hypothetical protein